jgi:DNA (cytosine-5)-methyltransferase 1
MTLTVGSLFSGIGGLDLGLERAGMEVIWQSEIDPYACRVLNKHWPKVVNHGNIKEINWTTIERPDVICGGYPCQPFSTAGQRKGEDDPRHLWPWVRECISVLRPRYAILENVRGHLSLGGTTVIREIANLGYCVEWRLVSAASVGANHRRERVILLAYPNDTGPHSPSIHPTERGKPTLFGFGRCSQDVANTNGRRQQKCQSESEQTAGSSCDCEPMADTESGYGRGEEPYGLREIYGQATKLREPGSPCGTLGNWWKIEPDLGRVAYGVPARVDRLRGLGNAVVPQVAETIGRLVMAHANENQ